MINYFKFSIIDETKMHTKRAPILAFWISYFVLFAFAFLRFFSEPNISCLLIVLVQLGLPILLFNSFEVLQREKRSISAQFMLALAMVAVLTGALTLAVTAPLTLLLGPDALRAFPESGPTAKAAYVVNKVYSLFDIMTFLGTIATLALVIMGSLIPEEARRHQEAALRLSERVRVTDDFFKRTNEIFSFDPTTKEFDSLILEKNRIWLLLKFLISNDQLEKEMNSLSAELDTALCLDRERLQDRNLDHKSLVAAQNKISNLVRRAS